MSASLKGLLAGLFFLALAGFFGWLYGGDLVSDFQHRGDRFAAVNDMRITEGRCRTKVFLLSFCEVKAVPTGTTGAKAGFDYFLLGGPGDQGVALMQSTGAGQSRYLTTSIGMDSLTHRAISLLVLVGLMLAISIGGFLAFFRKSAD